jgi:hypothetical protein
MYLIFIASLNAGPFPRKKNTSLQERTTLTHISENMPLAIPVERLRDLKILNPGYTSSAKRFVTGILRSLLVHV